MYRTMVIKWELTRRKAIENTRDRSSTCRQSNYALCDQDDVECQTKSHNITIADHVSTSAGTAGPAMYNRLNVSEMRPVFDLFDENKDGRISAEELQPFMRRLGFELSDQKVRDMIRTVDQNGDDCVDFGEFLSLYSSLCGEADHRTTGEYNVDNSNHCASVEEDADEEEEETLLKAFFIFDENKDGLISALELQQVLNKLGLPEGKSFIGCQKMIEKVDSDGNGQVDFFEFKEMMCSDAFSFCRP